MARKTPKTMKAQSKKNPKVGTSKKAKTQKTSAAKKQVAKAKVTSPKNKARKVSMAGKNAKAKKNGTELKKPAAKKTKSKPAAKTKKVTKAKAQVKGKAPVKKAAAKPVAKKSVSKPAAKNKNVKTKVKPKKPSNSKVTGPSMKEVQEKLLKAKQAKAPGSHMENPDASHASGKKHLNLSEYATDGHFPNPNNTAIKPDMFSKLGRATSPRANFPNK